jgi:hypothetical protein
MGIEKSTYIWKLKPEEGGEWRSHCLMSISVSFSDNEKLLELTNGNVNAVL